MLMIGCFLAFMCGFLMIMGLFPPQWESRPTLKTLGLSAALGGKKDRKKHIFILIKAAAVINKPICGGAFRTSLANDLTMARLNLIPEEFLFIQEMIIALVLFLCFPTFVNSPEMLLPGVFTSLAVGYLGPRLWVKKRIKTIKAVIVKELPDAIDLLGLCVNAGLDFMLSLKWVVEKSRPSVMVDELNGVLQEINVGKTRRDAIKDLASRYNLPDLSTFARTLIQADKMGTSVTDALNILSEDMRIARYRRGEQLALKAPLKMLVPLLVFIFPVVGILVAGPIMLDFVENNPFAQMNK